MNTNIEKLYRIAARPARLVIGLMSGTSVDGLDVALCRIEGSGTGTKLTLLEFETVPFDETMKNAVRSVFSKEQVNLQRLTILNPWIALQHAAIISDCLERWNIDPAEVDMIASHGQTIYHAPKSLHHDPRFGNATLQIGDGDHLALATGIITLSDFRQKNIAAGGEGAPLAVYGDYLLFSKEGEQRILLNIGGIANFTFLPADLDTRKIFSTDTGPGNTMMDACMLKLFGKAFDEAGAVASSGKIHEALLAALKDHAFFTQPLPKTTGPELFNAAYLEQAQERSGTTNMKAEDLMATLSRFTVDTICQAIRQVVIGQPVSVFASGGGIHNDHLRKQLQEALPGYRIETTADLHINPDAKEAILFALLANECVAGDPATWREGNKGMPAVSMGKISFPS